MTGIRFYASLLILASIILFLQYRLWFESDGVLDWVHLKKKVVKENNVTDQLKKKNETLMFQIDRLQHSNDAIENRARNELGMIKKNETFYQIVK